MAPLVLVVDNERGLLNLFASLAQRSGCEVLLAASGQTALEILADHTPDVMVLDLAMPELSGFDVLRQVITMPHLDGMRTMVLTATGPGPAPDEVSSRIDVWLLKPASPDIFRAALQQLIEQAGSE